MRLWGPARTILQLFLALSALHCRDARVGAGARDGADTALGECRSYAAAGSVRWSGVGGELTCEFDPGALEHTCRLSSADDVLTTRAEYASLADFVEAGKHLGKVTSLRETRTSDGARTKVEHRYDELGRLVLRIEEDSARTLMHQYSDHDDAGRPRRALSAPLSDAGECAALVVSIEYSDDAGTVSRRFRPADTARCGFAERTSVEQYDARGNPIAIHEADGAGVATRFEAAREPATRRVCL